MRYGYEVFHPEVGVIADFYVDVLGFEIESPDRDDQYEVVVRDGLRVGCSRHPDAPMTPRKPPTGSEIVLRVEDVHAEHERVLGSGWPFADPLEKRPWGRTDFRVFDPTGQYIRVTSDRACT